MDQSEICVDLGSHALNVRISGTDATPAVLMLHSLGLDRRAFDAIRELLPHWRVLSFDQRGHGEAAGIPISLEAMADDVVAVSDKLQLADFHLVGHSMGGVVAGLAAYRHPQRVRSLALLATPFQGNSAFEDRASAADLGQMREQMESTLARWFGTASIDAGAVGPEYARACLERLHPRDWSALWRAMASFQGFNWIGNSLPPTLCMSGDQDLSTPPDMLARIAAVVSPGTRHVNVRGAGHMFPLERPKAVAEALVSHWTDNN